MIVRKLFGYLRQRDWLFVLTALIFIICQVWLDLKLPDYMSEITQLVQTEGSAMDDILFAGGMMLLCALGSLAATFLTGWLVSKIAAGLAMRLREKVYDKTISFSMEEMGRFSTASLITRSTNDITQIQTFTAMGLQALVKAPIMAVWAMVKIAGKGWEWSAVTGGAVAVLLVMLGTLVALTTPKYSVIQQLTDRLNRIVREHLTGIRVVRAYHAEDYQAAKFEDANSSLTSVNLYTNRLMTVMQPGMTFIMSTLTLAIYWVGVYLINGAEMADKLAVFSDMVVFSSYAMQVIMAFMMLTMTLIILPRARVSARRVNEVMDTENTIIDGGVTASALYEQGEIEFSHVSFRYPGAADYMLHDISFTAHRGETVAFIGATGSGKSTLVNLLLRFYDATEGKVLVDGVNVKDYTQQALRGKLGYVPQKTVLFGGTIASNVAYGQKSARIQPLRQALHVAQAEEFVDNMRGGFTASVAQSGANLSGGQKQRLSIARAVYRQPEIYVLDDAFSALDYKTDRLVRNALKEETAGATTLIVSQRVGTVMNADRIIVLDHGWIAGQGRHEQLLKNCPIYREIAESQLSKEELYHV